jgi:hypothetical protein
LNRLATTSGQAEAVPGLVEDLLVSGSAIRPANGPFVVHMYRVDLAPGASVTSHRIDETEMVLAVDGMIEVSTSEGEIGVLTQQGTVSRRAVSVVLANGRGMTAYPGAEVAYRSLGTFPATLWIVTVTIDDTTYHKSPS